MIYLAIGSFSQILISDLQIQIDSTSYPLILRTLRDGTWKNVLEIQIWGPKVPRTSKEEAYFKGKCALKTVDQIFKMQLNLLLSS